MSMQVLWRWLKPLQCAHVLSGCKVHFIPFWLLFSCRHPTFESYALHLCICWSVHSLFFSSLSLSLSFFSCSAFHDGKYRPRFIFVYACRHLGNLPLHASTSFMILKCRECLRDQCCDWMCVWNTERDVCANGLQTGCNVAYLAVLAKCRRFNNGSAHLAPLSKEPALS